MPTPRPRLRGAPVVLVLAALAALLAPAAARAQADRVGEWRLLPTATPINPIHVGLLRTGKVLIASGSENDPTQTAFRAALWDPRTGTFTLQEVRWDLFCNGMSYLPDGRVLVTGGNKQYNPFRGLRTTTVFDPLTERFVQVQDMARGRWYPSNAALADGTTMTFSGWLETAGVPNDAVEIYDVPTGWSPEFRAPFVPPLYPWLHLVPGGKVFFSGSSRDSHLFDPATGAWTLNVARQTYAPTTAQGRRYGSSVLLPLHPEDGYRPRVMVMGGDNPATATAEIIDLGAPAPAWRALPPMSAPRIEMNAVLLPTGQVLALGGSARDNDASTASLDADLFDPATETWSPAGRSAIPRLYHSVALLLPDATVWVAGSNPFQGSYDTRMEIYSPAYLFTRDAAGRVVPAARPALTGAPARVGYGAGFTIQTPSAGDIARVVLVRPGSVTHAFDFEQRLVELTFTPGSGSLAATAPPGPTVAPPGYYMLFLVNRAGTPSVATFVHLSARPGNQPPDGAITAPAGDVTIRAGQAVSFAGGGTDADGSVARYAWIFPGGAPAASTAASPGAVTFAEPGVYTVSLTVVDDQGDNDPSPPVRTIRVEPPAFTASFTSPPEGATVNGSQTVGMAVSGGGRPPFTFTLRVDSTPVFAQEVAGTAASYVWNTASVPDGAHTLGLTVRDADGLVATATRTVQVANATGAIRVALTSPRPGERVRGTVWANVWVEGAAGPFSYRLAVGGTTVWSQSSSATHVTLPWDTTRTPDGPQTLTATVSTAGRSGLATVDVIVDNASGGGSPPAALGAAFTSPAEGATVSGTVAVGMTASGGTPNYTFTLRIDGAVVLSQSGAGTSATYSWSTTGHASGSHTLSLTVSDGAGATATAARTVTVSNSATGSLSVALTSPRPGETVSGTVWANVWVNAPAGTPPYRYTLGAAGQTVWSQSSSGTHVTLPWETTRTPNGSQTLTASATDAAGRAGSTSVTVNVQNAGGGGGGTPGPLGAGFSSPAEGATVSGPVTVGMTASGGTPPYTYALGLDGAAVSSQTTSATSASWTWNTAGTADGSHTLGLTVTDAAGQTATAARTVTVSNGATGPLRLALTTPRPGETVSGTVWANIWVEAPAGTPPYRYTLGAAGQTLWSQSSSGTHVTLPWETTRTPNGSQTLTASATDAAGRTGSTSVTVNVQNAGGGAPPPLGAGFSSPAEGATVAGSVAVGMTATGGTPPYTYTLRIDGTTVASSSSSATAASHAWDTTAWSDGFHGLSLTVSDAAGQSASASRGVTVSNTGGGGGALRIALTSPRPGTTVSGTVWANVWVEAPAGTPPYTYTLSAAGQTVWSEAATGTHKALPWETFRTPNGAQTLTATVRDAAGRTGSASVTVTVQNP